MQEEETAMLTIGSRLEWVPVDPGFELPRFYVWEFARFHTAHGHQNYNLVFNPACSLQAKAEVLYFNRNGHMDKKRTERERQLDDEEHWYNTVAEAKAACEIHAATGQFPPGVEST